MLGKLCIAALIVAGTLEGAEALPEIRVALAGSSACQGYGNTDPKLIYGWGEVIQPCFKKPVKIQNFAVSGYSTKKFIEKGIWRKLLASKPHYILMSLGANDGKPQPELHTDPNTGYRENLRRFARDAKAANAEIIFVTLNTSCVLQGGKIVRRDRLSYSSVMREVARETGSPCLDLERRQMEELNKLGYEKAEKLYRRFPGTGKIDHSHTNLEGAEMIAGIIVDELRGSSSGLKKYLKYTAIP